MHLTLNPVEVLTFESRYDWMQCTWSVLRWFSGNFQIFIKVCRNQLFDTTNRLTGKIHLTSYLCAFFILKQVTMFRYFQFGKPEILLFMFIIFIWTFIIHQRFLKKRPTFCVLKYSKASCVIYSRVMVRHNLIRRICTEYSQTWAFLFDDGRQ